MSDLHGLATRALHVLDPEDAHALADPRPEGWGWGLRGAERTIRSWPRTSRAWPCPMPSASRRGSTRTPRCSAPCCAAGFGFVECGTVTPLAPGRQSAPAPVPAHRGPGGDQPHGLQQPGAGGVRGAPGAARRRASSAPTSGPTRTPTTASATTSTGLHAALGPGRLLHDQHLLAQHAGPAGPADQGRAGGAAGPARRGRARRCRPRGAAPMFLKVAPGPGGRRGRGHRRGGRGPRPRRRSSSPTPPSAARRCARAHARRGRRALRRAAARACRPQVLRPSSPRRPPGGFALIGAGGDRLAAPTPTPRSAPAPARCSSIRRWSTRDRGW